MRYLFVSEYFWPDMKGGGEVNLLEKCKKLVKEGHQVSVLTSKSSDHAAYQREFGIDIWRYISTGKNPSSVLSNIKRAFVFKRSLIKYLRLMDKGMFELIFDEVHLHNSTAVAAKILQYSNVAVFCKVENPYFFCPKVIPMIKNKECNLLCKYERFIGCQMQDDYFALMKNEWYLKYNPFFWILVWYRYKNLKEALQYCRVITISKYMQRALEKIGIKSEIEPNIVNKDLFKPRKPAKNIKPMIVAAGSLIKYRGFQVLLQAVKGLNVEVSIFGNGVMKDELQKIIDDNKLDATIYPKQKYNRMPYVFAMADMIVVPSLYPEAEGRVAIEALAMNKRVIVSDIGALHDVKGALKFKPGDVKNLRRKIQNEIRIPRIKQRSSSKNKHTRKISKKRH